MSMVPADTTRALPEHKVEKGSKSLEMTARCMNPTANEIRVHCAVCRRYRFFGDKYLRSLQNVQDTQVLVSYSLPPPVVVKPRAGDRRRAERDSREARGKVWRNKSRKKTARFTK